MNTSSLVSLSQSQHNLIGLGSRLSLEERNDLMDLLAHAEGFADRNLDRQDDWNYWFYLYRNRLEKHGCFSTGSLGQTTQIIKSYADFDAQLDPIGAGGVPVQLLRHAREALGVLRASAFVKRFFQQGAADGQHSSFLVTPCLRDAQGQIVFATYFFKLNASAEMRDFDFWTETLRDITVWRLGTAYRFDRARFATFREPIQNDLLAWSRSSLQQLPLSR